MLIARRILWLPGMPVARPRFRLPRIMAALWTCNGGLVSDANGLVNCATDPCAEDCCVAVDQEVDVTLTGMANFNCADCVNFNDNPFLLAQLSQEATCTTRWQTLGAFDCGFNQAFLIVNEGATLIWFTLFHDSGGGIDWISTSQADMNDFCAGNEVAVPFSFNDDAPCDADSSIATVQLQPLP